MRTVGASILNLLGSTPESCLPTGGWRWPLPIGGRVGQARKHGRGAEHPCVERLPAARAATELSERRTGSRGCLLAVAPPAASGCASRAGAHLQRNHDPPASGGGAP